MKVAAVKNEAQRATLSRLSSVIDMSEAEVTPEDNGTVIFEGYSADGLAVGIVAADGQIEWVCGEVDLPGTPIEQQQTVRVVAWTWRDGSVHLEVRLATFADADEVVMTHLDGDGRFESACGTRWFGLLSSSGLGHSQRIDCPACREILRNATLVGCPQ